MADTAPPIFCSIVARFGATLLITNRASRLLLGLTLAT